MLASLVHREAILEEGQLPCSGLSAFHGLPQEADGEALNVQLRICVLGHQPGPTGCQLADEPFGRPAVAIKQLPEAISVPDEDLPLLSPSLRTGTSETSAARPLHEVALLVHHRHQFGGQFGTLLISEMNLEHHATLYIANDHL